MLTTFWDSLGIVYEEYLDHGATVTAERYFDTLMWLRNTIKRKRPGLLRRGVLLLHDNTRPHTTELVKTLLTDFKWDMIGHPAYAPDLTLSDYYLFPSLKMDLGGQHFPTTTDVRKYVTQYFRNLDT